MDQMKSKRTQEFLGRQRYYLGLIASWVLTLCWIAVCYWVIFIWDTSRFYRFLVGVALASGGSPLSEWRDFFKPYSVYLKEFQSE